MEIERKFLISALPPHLESYHKRRIEQGYLSTGPVVRVRRDNDQYYLTYKSSGQSALAHEEYNLPLTASAYSHLVSKADGLLITKDRYEIPDGTGHLIELDLFHGAYEGTVLAEVEFDSVEEAEAYTPPSWFTRDVTNDRHYHNSYMSQAREGSCHESEK